MNIKDLLKSCFSRHPQNRFLIQAPFAAVIAILLTTVPASAQIQAPVELGSVGYISSNAQTVHTTAAFNTVGASTLVMFVSIDTPWNGVPVSISGVTDNAGNSWQVLTGPTSWTGSQYGQVSGIYYVDVPVTSSAHMVTVSLTNPAPLVMDVFAVSGTDVTAAPVYSPITDPGTGQTSASVVTAPITVPTDTLLLGWVKNETGATATAIDGYTLDASSTSYLWSETETASGAGSYTGDFQYSAAIGWQTAVVGLRPASGPEALTVSSVSPSSGSTSGATAVTITGTNFASGAIVTFGTAAATNATVVNSTTISATTPAGSAGAVTVTVTVTVTNPASQSGSLVNGYTYVAATSSLSRVTLGPTSVIGGTSSTGTVTLTGPAPSGGAAVTLSSSNTAAAQVPASVTVAAGATTATFTITTSPVASNASVTISGTYGATKSTTLTVTAATLTSLTRSPTSAIGGTSSTGTVTLTGPAPSGGVVVTLTSSSTAVATVPASVTVPAGSTVATLTITTKTVTFSRSVTISANKGGKLTATLTVTPP